MLAKEKNKVPWPTKDAMQQVYNLNLWGGADADYYSGAGSHRSEIVEPYIKEVVSFLVSLEKPVIICDLGCGDFNIGRQLVPYASKYVAVDIVPELIERNKEKYQENVLSFKCLDLAQDDLPPGNVAILRQILQHLSNAEIKRIIPKLMAYDHIILTEHVPNGHFEPNLDIISGQGIRLKKKSGIDLSAAPFHMDFKTKRELISVDAKDHEGVIVTSIYS
jgi:hypothetical protein